MALNRIHIILLSILNKSHNTTKEKVMDSRSLLMNFLNN